jgi:hypothetical protein
MPLGTRRYGSGEGVPEGHPGIREEEPGTIGNADIGRDCDMSLQHQAAIDTQSPLKPKLNRQDAHKSRFVG